LVAATLQGPEGGEAGNTSEDIAVFPLAIPLLSGPGTITTILLLNNPARAGFKQMLVSMVVLAGVFIVAGVLLYLGDRLIRLLGAGKIHILTRVLGIVLAAVAVQYVLDGVRTFQQSLN
jgi:multiple antibiotic resistance protein